MMTMFQSVAGLLAFTLVAWLFSENRRRVSIKLIVSGVFIQLLVALVLLKLPLFQNLLFGLNKLVLALENSTKAGTSMVFGYLGGGPPPFKQTSPENSFILAFQALPLVVIFSAISSLLFYLKILPKIVKAMAWALTKVMPIGAAEGLGLAANVFLGMVESPLFIRPYLSQLTRSELFTLMVAGMATIAGTVMVVYASMLNHVMAGVMGHILTASVISVPAAVTIAKVMIPETGQITGSERLELKSGAMNCMDAITQGTMQGVQLLINICAMLVVLIALVHIINSLLGMLPGFGSGPITLQRLLGGLMAPIVWLMGVPWAEAFTAGSLMGTKTILNEFVAYLDMSRLEPGALSTHSMVIMTYALCGFANPGSLGILIGGLGTMAPERRDDIVSLGLRSILAGTLATCMTGAIVGIIGGVSL